MSREIIEHDGNKYVSLIPEDIGRICDGDYSGYVVYYEDADRVFSGCIPSKSMLLDLISNGAYVFEAAALKLGLINESFDKSNRD